jgi:hypothetical protein
MFVHVLAPCIYLVNMNITRQFNDILKQKSVTAICILVLVLSWGCYFVVASLNFLRFAVLYDVHLKAIILCSSVLSPLATCIVPLMILDCAFHDFGNSF